MAIDFKTFLSCAPHVIAVRKPILLRGRHGVGKSEVVYQVAENMSLPVVERRASQMTEGDLLGMPSPELVEVNGEQASVFRPFAWLIQACTEPVVLFLDEVDRATQEVRQGIFELTDSRKIAGWALHTDTIVIAAVNGGEHGDQNQVNEMDPAELARYTVFDVEPSVEDWLEWGKDNIAGIVWDFINQNRLHLEHKDDYEPNKVYPSRRSWKRLNDCLDNSGLLQESSPLLFNLATSFVGFEAAVAFNDFVKNYERVVTTEDILVHGKIDATSKFDLNEHCALIEKMEAEDTFKRELTDTEIQHLADYAVSLPSEAFMKMWQLIGKGDVLENTKRLHMATSVTGVRVSSYIVEVLTGNKQD